jgi:hypothetical protein
MRAAGSLARIPGPVSGSPQLDVFLHEYAQVAADSRATAEATIGKTAQATKQLGAPDVEGAPRSGSRTVCHGCGPYFVFTAKQVWARN